MRRPQMLPLAAAVIASVALVAISSADARGGERTVKALGSVVGKLGKVGFFGADGVPGPRKVDLTLIGSFGLTFGSGARGL